MEASVDYRSDTDRHQYLKLEVTRVDDKGRTCTTTVNGFYVPANGATTFNHWSNDLREHKGRITGVTEVQVKAVSATTSDENWQPYTYEVGGNPATVTRPSIP